MADLHLGTSGWSYPDWVGNFYPVNMKPIHFLQYYAKHFSTVELDTTFYAAPSSDVVLKWKEKVPPQFLFAAKFPKAITHDNKLLHCQCEVREFIQTMSLLEEHLGPLLIQLPYGFKIYEYDTLRSFLPTLPEGYKYVLEVRHRSWLIPKVYDLLRSHNISLVLFDHPWLPRVRIVTGGYVYIRWLGDRNVISKNFTGPKLDRTKKLTWWAELIHSCLQKDLSVYGFFNNNFSGHAPTAIWLLEDILAHRPPREGVLPAAPPSEDVRSIPTADIKTQQDQSAVGEDAFDKDGTISDIEDEQQSDA